MKLTIDRATLFRALAHVQSVVERRNTIPILSNVLIQAGEESVTLTATDMDLTIVEGVAAAVGTVGATTAPAHTLYDIVRKLPDGAEVELATSGELGQLVLKCGRSTFSLATLPMEDFPSSNPGDFPFGLQGEELRQLIDRTRFAISTEETRYYLNGIYLHATKVDDVDLLRAVATDGHRLARFETALPEGGQDMPAVILPRKAVAEVRKLIEEHDGPVEVSLSESRARFSFDSTVLTSKLIDGTFPDYERVIPSGNDVSLTVDCKALRESVDRVATISTERARAVMQALIERGVPPARLEARGVGYLAPVQSNQTEAGRALNRRVELVLKP